MALDSPKIGFVTKTAFLFRSKFVNVLNFRPFEWVKDTVLKMGSVRSYVKKMRLSLRATNLCHS